MQFSSIGAVCYSWLVLCVNGEISMILLCVGSVELMHVLSVLCQADVCHAYQILKKGGLKDENIVVFMYDDIAYNRENPRPGVIINNPHGEDVYEGVPKVRVCFKYPSFLSAVEEAQFFLTELVLAGLCWKRGKC